MPNDVSTFLRVDVRAEKDFLPGHMPGSANIPLEELAARAHELPAADRAVTVIDADARRAESAADFLRRRGHVVEICAGELPEPLKVGPAKTWHWQPSPFLVEAAGVIAQSRPLSGLRALDVACGSGREAVWLALQGCAVEAVDLLPDAIARAEDLARRHGVTLRAAVVDVETNPVLPSAAYDLVCVFRFLHRPLFATLRESVVSGGYVVYQTFHEANLATGRPPRSPGHLLKTQELEQAFLGWRVHIARDAMERDGRFFSELLAQKP